MPTRRGYRREPVERKAAPSYSSPTGMNSPNAIIRLASGSPYKAAAPSRPIRQGRGFGGR